MSLALITGASGFVGGHLAETLVRGGQRVRCLVRRTSRTAVLDALDVETVVGDVTHETHWSAWLRDVDTVYHVAALTRSLSAAQMMRVNAGATQQLARACARQPNPPRVVLISSLAAKGTCTRRRWAGDYARARPVSHYGRSKRAAELAALRWAERVPLTIVRPGVVMGPRDRDTATLFQSVKRLGIHLIPGFRWSHVAVIDVRDLAQLIFLAATRGQAADPQYPEVGIYDAADPQIPSYAQLGRFIGRAVHRPDVLMVHVPVPLLMSGAVLAECAARVRRVAMPFNLDKMRDAVAGSWTCDALRSQQQLGFQSATPLEQRIWETARWYEQAGWL